MSKLHAALLPKLGVMKTFPIIMRTSPTFLGSLNLYQLEVETIAQAIQYLVSLYSSNTPTRLLLKTMIEYYQIELSTDIQFFSLEFEACGILATPTWILLLLQHACHFNISINLPALNLGIEKQEGDAFILDMVIQL